MVNIRLEEGSQPSKPPWMSPKNNNARIGLSAQLTSGHMIYATTSDHTAWYVKGAKITVNKKITEEEKWRFQVEEMEKTLRTLNILTE